jgi:hypothetical protein
MADENKISRRTFLKGLAATGAVATTGIPTKAGPDKFTTMMNSLQKDFKKIQTLNSQRDALRMSPAGIIDLAKKGEITKSFANKAIALVGRGVEKDKKRKNLIEKIKVQGDKLRIPYNEKLANVRDYAKQNKINVAINRDATTTKLKRGEKVKYKQPSTYLGSTPTPSITTADFRAAKKAHEAKTGKKISSAAFGQIYNKSKSKPKSAVKGGRGAGAGANQEGVHTIFEGPKLVKVEKDYRKGGMVILSTDNRKKR